MELTPEKILELRTSFLKANQAIKEIYIPRFCDDKKILAMAETYTEVGRDNCRIYGVEIRRDNSRFDAHLRVVYESSVVVDL